MDIPALGDVVVFDFFSIGIVDFLVFEVRHISVCRTRGGESLSHRMFSEAFESGNRPIEMPLG